MNFKDTGKGKMKKILKLTKKQNSLIVNYLQDCYNCKDFDCENTKENIFKIFFKEVGCRLKAQKYSFKESFVYWLSGLASACAVDFESYKQESLLKDWQISIKKGEDVSDVFYAALANAFFSQFSYPEICNLINEK